MSSVHDQSVSAPPDIAIYCLSGQNASKTKLLIHLKEKVGDVWLSKRKQLGPGHWDQLSAMFAMQI